MSGSGLVRGVDGRGGASQRRWHPAGKPWSLVSLGLLAPLLVAASIVIVFVPLTPAYDLSVFVRAGSAVVHGLDVYPSPSAAAVYSGSSFVYPYFSAVVFVPFALVDYERAVAAFFALSLGALAMACLWQTRGDFWQTAMVLGTSFAVSGLQLGALSPLLVAGTVFVWRARERPWLLAVLAAPVICAKLFLIPLLAWLLLARRWRALVYTLLVSAALLSVGFVAGPLGPGAYIQLLSALGHHEARAGFGLIGVLMQIGLSSVAAEAIALIGVGLLLALAHRYDRIYADERVLFCAGLLSALALSPVVWSHYLLLLAAALLVLEVPRRWMFTLLVFSWLTAPAHGIRVQDELVGIRAALWIPVVVALGYATVGLARAGMRGRPGRPHRPAA